MIAPLLLTSSSSSSGIGVDVGDTVERKKSCVECVLVQMILYGTNQ